MEAMVGGPELSADVVATVLGGCAFLQLGITRTLGGGDIVFDGDATHLSQGGTQARLLEGADGRNRPGRGAFAHRTPPSSLVSCCCTGCYFELWYLTRWDEATSAPPRALLDRKSQSMGEDLLMPAGWRGAARARAGAPLGGGQGLQEEDEERQEDLRADEEEGVALVRKPSSRATAAVQLV